ncbi:lipase [Micrococcus luteus]|uniref:lipase family protein n=2 Tax=Micrococcus luteus TaxID=1270 RepID=UPI002550A31F|nr:lipase family protein [Micrococcus luteus]MCV7693571.1 lipase family protein [Micrococcus luteus]MDK7869365.1 lipase family protein [Micrococcus luteus]MDK8525841.1 lipase family protein [Micrococcus luteus]MDK8728982.1 lipase family protein [Micrococcus luteus]
MAPAHRPSRPLALAAALAVVAGFGAPHAALAQESAPAPDAPEVSSAVEDLSQPATAAEDARWNAARDTLAAASADDPFYLPPTVVPATPGALIRTEPTAFYLDPVRLVQVPAHATRIMYASQDAQGRPIAVTGTVLTPTAPWTGGGERPVISYAVGTQGAADRCAPSRTLSTGVQYEGVGITSLLSRGHAVVVTDYEGLGTPGTHTYMVREAQAHAVLDAVRAAAQVSGSGVTATAPVALAGYSQGGGAAAAAAELASDYAPELDLKGAYVGAPPADLVQVADRIDGGLYAAFLLYAMAGQLAAYDVDPATHLNETGLTALAGAAETCMVGSLAYAHLDSATLTHTGQDFPELVRSDAELAGILAEQRIGAPGRRPDVPVMIAHSVTDDVIPYRTGRDLGRRWCAEGARVRFDPLLTPTHVGGHVASLPRMGAFLDATLADRWTADSCGWF